jgi:hypothetical protein
MPKNVNTDECSQLPTRFGFYCVCELDVAECFEQRGNENNLANVFQVVCNGKEISRKDSQKLLQSSGREV